MAGWQPLPDAANHPAVPRPSTWKSTWHTRRVTPTPALRDTKRRRQQTSGGQPPRQPLREAKGREDRNGDVLKVRETPGRREGRGEERRSRQEASVAETRKNKEEKVRVGLPSSAGDAGAGPG